MIQEPMTGKTTLRMDAAGLNAFLLRAFPEADPESMPRVTSMSPGRVMLTMPTASRNLRPGGVISGPTLMSLSDTAAYALVLAHIGEVAMAVTTSPRTRAAGGLAAAICSGVGRRSQSSSPMMTARVGSAGQGGGASSGAASSMARSATSIEASSPGTTP
jgi:acyl-coenzyme A thioesterase PaaI-like protein